MSGRCCTLTTVRAPHPFLWAVAHPSGASISSPGVCLSVRATIFFSGHRKKSDLGPESRNCVPDRGFGCLAGLPAVSGAKKSRKKVAKRFGGKEKSSTFAIPFGKRGCERGEERHPDGHGEIIDKTGTEVQMKYRNNKRER